MAGSFITENVGGRRLPMRFHIAAGALPSIPGARTFDLFIIGGGGGGGGVGNAALSMAGGGGASGVVVAVYGVSLADYSAAVFAVGAGGAGGVAPGHGADGGSTSLSIGAGSIIAPGGGGGTSMTTTGWGAAGRMLIPAAGIANTSGLTIRGAPCSDGQRGDSFKGVVGAGNGGGNMFAIGGSAAIVTGSGSGATGPGGGGGGAYSASAAVAQNGGNGNQGGIFIIPYT